MVEKRKEIVTGLTVLAAAILVYLNSLGNDFVWDDNVVILANASLKGSIGELFRGIDSGRLSDATPYYRPLTLMSFLLEGRIHNFSPFLVRLVSILLHSVNSYLVFRLAGTLGVSRWGALFAGLLFAVHPVNSESVNFNSGGRNTMLAVFFVLCAYLVHRESINRDSFRLVCLGAILFLAGIFSKETALLILPFICYHEVARDPGSKSQSLRRSLLRCFPYIFSLFFYLILRNNALSHAGVKLDPWPGLVPRLMDNAYIIPRYALNIIWPMHLSPQYYVPEDLHLYVLPLVGGWSCLILVFCWLIKRNCSQVTWFGIAWMVAFWLPVSGLIPIPSAQMADRYFYAPGIGLWIIIGHQASSMALSDPGKRIMKSVVVLLLILLGITTAYHNRIWKDDIRLFTYLIKLYPEQALGHHNLGCAYLDKVKNVDLAERSFEKALALNPFFPRLQTQLGYVRLLRGDLEGAIAHYNEAIYLNPVDPEALLNRGEAFERAGRYDEALDSYRRFLATPGNELSQARITVVSKVDALSRRIER